jgi:hypothetical protein
MRKVFFVLAILLCQPRLFAQSVTFSIEGDSISDSDPNRWSAYFKPMMDAKFSSTEAYDIWAASGDTVSNMVNEYPTQAHTVAPGTNIGFFTLWVPINDIDAGDTAGDCETNTGLIWGMARADGYKVAAFIPTPNYNWTNGDPRWTVWSNYCSWVWTQTNSYDYLIPAGLVLTQTDLIDGLHPTVSGAMKAANLVSNVLFFGDASLKLAVSDLTVKAPVGNTYVLESTGDFGSWLPVSTNLVPADGEIILQYSPTGSNQFYRSRFVR